MKESTAARAARWKSCSAIAGKMLRSMPTIAPTKALTTTRRENCARFARSPRRIVALVVLVEVTAAASHHGGGADLACRGRFRARAFDGALQRDADQDPDDDHAADDAALADHPSRRARAHARDAPSDAEERAADEVSSCRTLGGPGDGLAADDRGRLRRAQDAGADGGADHRAAHEKKHVRLAQ